MASEASRVVVITGGSSGIGRATVKLFHSVGWRVVFCDLLDAEGRALAQELGEGVHYVPCDVTQEEEVRGLIAETQARFGGLDALVNNAGSSKALGGIATLALEDWEALMAVHLRGAFLGIKHATPLLAARGGGSIVNMGSVAGLSAGFGPYPYSVAKAAVIHLTRMAAVELAEQRVRVNCVCPGMVATPIFGRAFGLDQAAALAKVEPLRQAFADTQPLPGSCLPEDVAQAILWLAADSSRFVTGEILVLDGGLTLGRKWSESGTVRQKFQEILL